MTSRPMWKGERLTLALPAASLLDCMITLTVSTGCMTDVAMQPEMEPTMNGLNRAMNLPSFGFYVYVAISIFKLY